jgi:hypothetical protein
MAPIGPRQRNRATPIAHSADTIGFDGGPDVNAAADPWQVVPLQNAWIFRAFKSQLVKLCGSRNI